MISRSRGRERVQDGRLSSQEKAGRGILSGHQDIRSISGEISCKEILSTVSERCGISVNRLCGPERSRSIVVWRQAAHWLCKELTSLSLPAIGRAVNRDHTSVLYSIERTEKRMEQDPGIKQYLTILRNDLAVRFQHD